MMRLFIVNTVREPNKHGRRTELTRKEYYSLPEKIAFFRRYDCILIIILQHLIQPIGDFLLNIFATEVGEVP